MKQLPLFSKTLLGNIYVKFYVFMFTTFNVISQISFKAGSQNAKMLLAGMSRSHRSSFYSMFLRFLLCSGSEVFRIFGLVFAERGGKNYQEFTKKSRNSYYQTLCRSFTVLKMFQ